MSNDTRGESEALLGIERGHVVPLLGASLLSAAGSLPLHLMPLIVVSLIADGRTSLSQAGWIATAVLVGQLSVTLVLPFMRIDSVRRRFTISTSLVLVVGLLATDLDGPALLFIGWGIVGTCCGVLQYVGTTTAASHVRPIFAFSLRLGVVLVVAGIVAGAVHASGVLGSYRSLLIALGLFFGSVLVTGVAFYRVSPHSAKRPGPVVARTWSVSVTGGLMVIFILFFGQTGFLAYAVQGAVSRGIQLDDAAWAVAGMKLTAGVALLSLAQKWLHGIQRPRFLELGAMLGGSIVIVTVATGPAEFFIGLLGIELGLNFLSARLLGKVSETAPQLAGRWITGTVLLGAACGPPAYGAVLGIGMGIWFIVFALLSALGPFVWLKIRQIAVLPSNS